MARAKGMLNLSGNLEVNAQAPLDARTIVPTEADLTVASNFPYPYVGLEVYVTGTGKKFRLVNLDTTQSSSWHEVSEGGGETYSDFTGATESAAGTHGLVPAPAIGDESKVLFGDGAWGVLPSVDLSMLSNEAFQFSTDEKPVGMWTDRKIVYAKTVECGALPNNNTKNIAHGISNLDKVYAINGVAINSSGNSVTLPNAIKATDECVALQADRTNVIIITGADWSLRNGYVTMLYTKTTDSPLASDEKYAGLTASGSVVYKKTVSTGGSVPSGATLIYRLALLNGTDVVYYTKTS